MHLTRLGVASDVADACVYLASRESEFVTGVNLQLDGGSSIAHGSHARLRRDARPVRASARSRTFKLSLADDLAFWARHGITNVGVSVAKLEAFGWEPGTQLVVDAVERGLHVVDLIGLGPFHLADPSRWDEQRIGSCAPSRPRHAVGARSIVFTTGPFAPLTWEEAADTLEEAHRAGARRGAQAAASTFAIEHTNSLRVDVGFVHTLRDAIDLARRLDIGVCMELNACWAERGLAATIRDGIDRIRLVQVSDFKVGTVASSQRLVPGDGDIPIARILGDAARPPGTPGVFELELIGDAIVAEGYDARGARAVDALDAIARATSAPDRYRRPAQSGGPHRPRRRPRAAPGSPGLRSRRRTSK